MSEKTIGRTFWDLCSEIKWILLILILLLLGVLFYAIRSGYKFTNGQISIEKDENEINKFSSDPLKVKGKWIYEVYSEQQSIPVRARNPKTNNLEEKYKKIGGDIHIDTISKQTGRYKIEGNRTFLIDSRGMNVMPSNSKVSLNFPEVDYDNYSNNKFSFKFEVTVGDDFGFVRLKKVQPREMEGIIHYLYADKQWRMYSIKFTRQD